MEETEKGKAAEMSGIFLEFGGFFAHIQVIWINSFMGGGSSCYFFDILEGVKIKLWMGSSR